MTFLLALSALAGFLLTFVEAHLLRSMHDNKNIKHMLRLSLFFIVYGCLAFGLLWAVGPHHLYTLLGFLCYTAGVIAGGTGYVRKAMQA